MKKIDVNPPSGTRDFLPEEVKFREAVFAKIKKVFESFGFLPLETPAFERLEVLSGKYGEEGEKLIYKILKRGEKGEMGESDLALRYDFTIPLARIVARYRDKLPSVFRRYQIGPVWRADRPGKGRFREFYQCDVDTVGSDSRLADAEILLVVSRVLNELDLPRFEIRINSRKVLLGLLDIYEVPKPLEKSVLIALDKLDKVGVSGVKKELEERGLSEKSVKLIISDLGDQKAENVLRGKLERSTIGKEGLEEVDEILEFVTPLLERGKIVFSPFLARGLDYYTGPIYEIFVEEMESSIAAGGRYDELIGMFIGKNIPACGVSLGVERILEVFKEKPKKEKKTAAVQALVAVWEKSFRAEALRLAEEIRKSGIRTEVYLGEGDISKQLRFASERGIRYCVIFGPDEKAKKMMTVKNLETGEQKTIPQDKLISSLS